MAKNIEVTLTLDTKGYNKKLKAASQQTAAFGGSSKVATGSIMGLAARFAPAAAGLVAVGSAFKLVNDSMETARGFQDVEITLTNLIGSAEGGAAALAMIDEIAGKLPNDFEELAKSAPALTTVSGTIGELEENMLLAADIAANFGIPFEVAASQLQRSFSAGAGAADVFREKGVLSAAGFQAGMSYSIDETRAKLAEFGESIEGSAEKLNDSLSGALSQASDRFTKFKNAVGQAIIPEYEAFLKSLVESFTSSKEEALAFGDSIGTGVVEAFKSFLRGGALVIDYLTMLFNMFRSLAKFIQDTFGGAIAIVMDGAVRVIGGVIEQVSNLGIVMGKVIGFATGNDDMEKFFKGVQEAAKTARTGGIDQLKVALGEMGDAVPVTTTRDFVNNLIADMDEGRRVANEKAEQLKNDLGDKGKEIIVEVAQSTVLTVEQFAAQFGALADGVLNTIKVFESSTKKLSDDLATALIEGQGAGEAFKNYFKGLVKEIIAQAIRLSIIQPLLTSIFGVQFGAGGVIEGFSGGLFGRASGGPVSPGGTYLIGEKGPELLKMGNQGGTIIPNNQIGAGGGTTIINNITAMDTQSVKEALAKQDPEFIFGLSQAGARRVPG